MRSSWHVVIDHTDSEIAEPNVVVARQEHVLRLQISAKQAVKAAAADAQVQKYL
jgi:hypothetical protein